ncbi:hypothetical protein IWQ61_005125 [Dispira simplex]|nr:hypothetical protein IWQ61_005125 [Dispira simplex]
MASQSNTSPFTYQSSWYDDNTYSEPTTDESKTLCMVYPNCAGIGLVAPIWKGKGIMHGQRLFHPPSTDTYPSNGQNQPYRSFDEHCGTTSRDVDSWSVSPENSPAETSLANLLRQDAPRAQIIQECRVNPALITSTASKVPLTPPTKAEPSVANGFLTGSSIPEQALISQWPIPLGSYKSQFFNTVLHQINTLARKTNTIIRYLRIERAIEIRGQQRNILTAKGELDNWYHQKIIGPFHVSNPGYLKPTISNHKSELATGLDKRGPSKRNQIPRDVRPFGGPLVPAAWRLKESHHIPGQGSLRNMVLRKIFGFERERIRSIEGTHKCKIEVFNAKRTIVVTARTRGALKTAGDKVRNLIRQSHVLLESEPKPTHMFGIKPDKKLRYYFSRMDQRVMVPGAYSGLPTSCHFKLKAIFYHEEPIDTLAVAPGLANNPQAYLADPSPYGDCDHISNGLIRWLDRLRWFRGMVELRIHFGELYFTNFLGARSGYPSELASTFFTSPDVYSVFVPSLKFGAANFQCLVNRLELKTLFKHTSTREGFLFHCHDAGVPNPTSQQEYRVQFLLSNRNKPTGIGWSPVSSWKMYTDRQTWVDFRCANLEGPFDWRMALSTSCKIPSKSNSKYQILADGFTLNKDGSFSFTNTSDIHVHSIAYETVAQLKYNGFVITATQHQWWNCGGYNVFTNEPYPVRNTPDQTTFSLSIGVERWEHAFLEHSQYAAGLPVKYKALELVNPVEMDQLWRFVRDVHAALQ